MSLFNLRHGVIVAADVKTLDDLLKLTDETTGVDGIVGYKVGFLLGLRHGLPYVVGVLRSHTDKTIIYDHQKAGTDIPEMGPEFAGLMLEAGANGAIIFPEAGPVTEESFIKSLNDVGGVGVVPIVGGEMTHKGYLAKEGGFIRDDAPILMYQIGAENGARHFIVPGNRPEKIRLYTELLSKYDPVFGFPGIGRQGGDIRSAFEACGKFSSYGIIGSGIYRPKEGTIRDAAKRFADEALNVA